jgi:hypothetical protein
VSAYVDEGQVRRVVRIARRVRLLQVAAVCVFQRRTDAVAQQQSVLEVMMIVRENTRDKNWGQLPQKNGANILLQSDVTAACIRANNTVASEPFRLDRALVTTASATDLRFVASIRLSRHA